MPEALNINVVIPAAGASSRMGKPKALLPVRNKPIIESQVVALKAAGLFDIFVVTNQEEMFNEILKECDVYIISPEHITKSMIESIRCGMAHFNAEPDGMMIIPSDFPYLTKALLSKISSTFFENPEMITVPTFQGKRGHPVIFPARLFDAVKTRFDETGIRGLYTAFPDSICEVKWEDDSILKNMNTQNDYEDYLNWVAKHGVNRKQKYDVQKNV